MVDDNGPRSRLSTRCGSDLGEGSSVISSAFGPDGSSASSVISLSRCWRKEEDEEVLDRCEDEENRIVERPRALSDSSCAEAKEKTVS